MPYVSQVPDTFFAVQAGLVVVDFNQMRFLNELFYNEEEVTGPIVADNLNDGDPNVAEVGETVTIPTANGPIVGTYIGPVNFSTSAVDLGIPPLLTLEIKLNDIDGYAVRAPDGRAYVVANEPISDDRIGASVNLVVGGFVIPIADAPVSELNDTIIAALNARANTLGPFAGAPIRALAATLSAGADIGQQVLDGLMVTLKPSNEPFSEGVVCFLSGTLIATAQGEKPIETLTLQDLVATADGRFVPVVWIGRMTFSKHALDEKHYPVLITKDALGPNLPHTDLYVSANHAMSFGEILVDAKALVNGQSIRFVELSELPDSVTYYHIETQAHEELLANGAAAESFIDYKSRSVCSNYEAYLETYGAERIIREMNKFRISSARQLPQHLLERLGITSLSYDPVEDFEEELLRA